MNYMKYYSVAEMNIIDAGWVSDYVREVTELVEKFGGRYLARTSNIEKLEGTIKTPQIFIIIEWHSKEHALDFYKSVEYEPYLENRINGSKSELTLVAGEDITKTENTSIR